MKPLFGSGFYEECLRISDKPSYIIVHQLEPTYVSPDMRRIPLEFEVYQGKNKILLGKDTPNMDKEDVEGFSGIESLILKLETFNEKRNTGKRDITLEGNKVYIEPKEYNYSLVNAQPPHTDSNPINHYEIDRTAEEEKKANEFFKNILKKD